MKKETKLIIKHVLSEKLWLPAKLNWRYEPAPVKGADAIAVIDGTHYHGGLGDRLKGIVTLYAYCKQRGLGFRILHTYPFRLEDYLEPASYDWRLKPGEFTNNIRHCRLLHMRGEYPGNRLKKLHTKKQIHFDGNRDCLPLLNADRGTDYQWGELFRELFKPTPEVAEKLKTLKAEIGGTYNASVFRFQNKLGDFKEYNKPSISSANQRNILIDKCLDGLKKHMADTGGHPMLVTSDSVTFLAKAAGIEGVSIIPGTLSHMDGETRDRLTDPYGTYMKSFLDFYMLSDAQTIACIGTPQMYPSQFPLYAAKVHDKPFCRITV